MHTFIILISSPAITPANGLKAITFAETALTQGHTIHSVFFSGDASTHANSLQQFASDETNMQQRWQAFSNKHHIPLISCTTAASRRGVLSELEAQEQQLPANMASKFSAGGLVELVAGISKSTRLVKF